MKTFVYVDAFNLYYGAVKGTPYKWLDLSALCSVMLHSHHQVECIKYFTAKVSPKPYDQTQHLRQEIFIRALETLPMMHVYYGHFLCHVVKMPLANPVTGLRSVVEVIRTDEKGSDVNLATHLLVDGFRNAYECAVLITGDSDQLTPVQVVKNDLKKPVGVLNPQKHPCRVLMREATFYKQIRTGALTRAQFPATLKDAKGTFTKPATW